MFKFGIFSAIDMRATMSFTRASIGRAALHHGSFAYVLDASMQGLTRPLDPLHAAAVPMIEARTHNFITAVVEQPRVR